MYMNVDVKHGLKGSLRASLSGTLQLRTSERDVQPQKSPVLWTYFCFSAKEFLCMLVCVSFCYLCRYSTASYWHKYKT